MLYHSLFFLHAIFKLQTHAGLYIFSRGEYMHNEHYTSPNMQDLNNCLSVLKGLLSKSDVLKQKFFMTIIIQSASFSSLFKRWCLWLIWAWCHWVIYFGLISFTLLLAVLAEKKYLTLQLSLCKRKIKCFFRNAFLDHVRKCSMTILHFFIH